MDRKSIFLPKGKEKEVGERIRERRKKMKYKSTEMLSDAITQWSVEQEYIRIQNKHKEEIARYLIDRAEEIEDDDEIVKEYIDKLIEKEYEKNPAYKMGKVFVDGGKYISAIALEKIERGERRSLHRDTFEALCAVLECSKDYLLLKDRYPHKLSQTVSDHIEPLLEMRAKREVLYTLYTNCGLVDDFQEVEGKPYIMVNLDNKDLYATNEDIDRMVSDLAHYAEMMIPYYFKDNLEAL